LALAGSTLALTPLSSGGAAAGETSATCAMEIVVLGAGQDAGAPQLGNAGDDGPRLLPTSLGLIDRELGQRFLFEATPAVTEQVHALDRIAPPDPAVPGGLGLDGVFLTHAHIGHYLGLAQFGFESASARRQRVFAMPRMAAFLRENGPWSQLVEFGNIDIVELAPGDLLPISDTFGVRPITVPHRDEYSETVGYILMTPDKTALFLPDLDSWEQWEASSGDTLKALIERVDYAFVDASFYDDNELPGRDMSMIPHPRTSHTMARLADSRADIRARVHFIHYNHTNPIRDPASAQSKQVLERGFNIARRGDRYCLSRGG
jgi:pyrroloquinoline quinone biosynthesis protein B